MKQDFTPFIVIAGIGAAGYFLYSNGMFAQWFPSLFGAASLPVSTSAQNPVLTTAPPSTAVVNPANPPSAPVIDPSIALRADCAAKSGRWDDIAQYCIPNFTQAPAPPALRRAVLSNSAFMQQLQQLAGGNIPLNIDQWDYYTKQIDPSAVVDTDHFGVTRGADDSFYASQFVDMRTSAGLPLPSGLSGLRGISGSRVPRLAIHRGYV